MNLQDYLHTHTLITDGAFGTYYAEKYQTSDMPEAANLTHPKRVLEIHQDYIRAGARLIRTNTFASNTVLLKTSWENTHRNITDAIALAKQAANGCFIAGDIGPIPPSSMAEATLVEEEYYQIAKTFLEEGIDILHFETFPDLHAILPAIRRIKATYDVFIMVSFCVNQFGYSDSGLSAKHLLSEANRIQELDAIGLNCGVGPGHMQQLLERMGDTTDKFRIAIPNAGYPTLTRNQIHFGNTPVYFAEKMQTLAQYGCAILGGCCGTNPDFIRQMCDIVDTAKQSPSLPSTVSDSVSQSRMRRGFLYTADGQRKTKKMIAVELAPPFNADDEKLLEAAHILQNADVDVLTFPDSPSGRTRVDSVLMAEKVRKTTGLEVMPHICCRDKNAVAIRSQLLGAQINDIHNMLLITGDPLPTATRQTVKAVFNFNSVGLMEIANEMNEELFADSPLCYGGAINQGRANIDIEIKRIHKKLEAGAEFFFTQPIFTLEDVKRVRYIKEETGATIFCGIMPLVSYKNASFMKNEIAGVNVTDEIVNRYPTTGTKEDGEAVGIALAKEIIEMVEDFADGYYFSFPFNRVHLLEKILKK